MNHSEREAQARFVRELFGRIARRYDLLNRLMTFGQDTRLRREAIDHLDLNHQPLLLDVGAGTGELTIEGLRHTPQAQIVAIDLTPEMIDKGRMKFDDHRVNWVIADAYHLPFAYNIFDGVMSSFLLRNLSDIDQALAEQQRVLKPAGRIVCLETTPPTPGLLRPLIAFYLLKVIPLLGHFIAKEREAYCYLPKSTMGFISSGELIERIRAVGFDNVHFLHRLLGAIAIYWAEKTHDWETAR